MIILSAFSIFSLKFLLLEPIERIQSNYQSIMISSFWHLLFVIPFLAFPFLSNFLKLKLSKIKVIQFSSYSGIAISLFITLSFFLGSIPGLLISTLLLAIKTAVYLPAKYFMLLENSDKRNQYTLPSQFILFTIIAFIVSHASMDYMFSRTFDATSVTLSEAFFSIKALSFFVLGPAIIEGFIATFLRSSFRERAENSITQSLKSNSIQHLFSNKNLNICFILLGALTGVGYLFTFNTQTFFSHFNSSTLQLNYTHLSIFCGIGTIIGLFGGNYIFNKVNHKVLIMCNVLSVICCSAILISRDSSWFLFFLIIYSINAGITFVKLSLSLAKHSSNMTRLNILTLLFLWQGLCILTLQLTVLFLTNNALPTKYVIYAFITLIFFTSFFLSDIVFNSIPDKSKKGSSNHLFTP